MRQIELTVPPVVRIRRCRRGRDDGEVEAASGVVERVDSIDDDRPLMPRQPAEVTRVKVVARVKLEKVAQCRGMKLIFHRISGASHYQFYYKSTVISGVVLLLLLLLGRFRQTKCC